LDLVDLHVIDFVSTGTSRREMGARLRITKVELSESLNRIDRYLRRKATSMALAQVASRDQPLRELAAHARRSVDTLLQCLDALR